MKRRVIGTLLGIVASLVTAVSSHGQGQIWFDNYNNQNPSGPNSGYSSPISVGNGPLSGQLAPVGFTVELHYVLGTAVDPNPGNPSNFGFGTLAASSPVSMPGYVLPSIATIPTYTSGPITFQLDAFGTISGNQYRGKSPVLTLPSIATGTTLPGFLDGLQSFSVFLVPEPGTLTLVICGGAAWIMRRRIASRTQ